MSQEHNVDNKGWVMTKMSNFLWRVVHPSGAITEHKTEDSALKAMTLTINN